MRRDGAKARDFAGRHGVARATDNAEELLAMGDIDAVYIATPPAHHLEYAKAALAAGKHVYLEKPMAMNAGECREIVEAERASGLKAAVAHYRRRMPAFLKVWDLLGAGAIGKPHGAEIHMLLADRTGMVAKAETNWRLRPEVSGGGLFHDLAPHQLDLMRVFFGEAAEYVGSARRRPKMAPCATAVSGTIRFESGVEFEGQWDFNAAGEEREECVITGDLGTIRFGFFGNEASLTNEKSGEKIVFNFDAPAHVQQPMIEAVNAWLRGEGECPCSTTDGLRVMEIIDGFTGQ
jgi:predicted dehydrogenase